MLRLLFLLLLALLSPDLLADNGSLSALTVTTNSDGSQSYSVTLQVLAIMTALSFVPAMVIMMTSFTRIIVVLAILRQAIGLQQTPSNQVLIGITLFLTFFIMAPVFKNINEQAIQPYLAETLDPMQALDAAIVPLKAFMLHQTRVKDLDTFAQIAGLDVAVQPQDYPMTIVIPAFVTSELKTAFQIGFMLFIPFLIIDLVVASVLMAMGMMMLSPMIISLPFKLMMFVLVDGWILVMGTLATSYGVGT
ncbi:flagellar type III secretion system pore protein FliP [Alishewanella sp. 16-MA]|uniref:Flagellar biosynthetic protein FliP n=1 Tax=Alishewanella maricola TaxID=2795740 RepID=A0ABS8C603_9ALTE|nr:MULTISPECIES: flagellar type III secretion system pore protein FliP [Alishewanella]MDP5036559.1 flagellar type III secretion system pore protein FliP [Alishewanella sp.]MDP5208109.1 flagellar type III secretion system pore protein FliP [Alishewanella sp. SMS9]MCB5227774.1 flagellar type III secretion system pore protein FliP [Alishewanella maricola]MDP5186475.1 flagellar type III secretion system pore protein FliP [Alishewanella sp.]MDP5459958.1 flagellar type III secretion system pore prot